MVRIKQVNWDKKDPLIVGWKEGYVELKRKNGSGDVTIEVGVNKLHEKTYDISATSNVIMTPKINMYTRKKCL